MSAKVRRPSRQLENSSSPCRSHRDPLCHRSSAERSASYRHLLSYSITRTSMVAPGSSSPRGRRLTASIRSTRSSAG